MYSGDICGACYHYVCVHMYFNFVCFHHTEFGVANHQQSNGVRRSSLATLCADVQNHAVLFNHLLVPSGGN